MFRRRKRYEGLSCYCVERSVVPHPGHYALKPIRFGRYKGQYRPNPKRPLRWVEEVPEDPDHHGGHWERI